MAIKIKMNKRKKLEYRFWKGLEYRTNENGGECIAIFL